MALHPVPLVPRTQPGIPGVLGGDGDELLVTGLQSLLGQRAGVIDSLLADAPEARGFGRVVLVGRPGVDDAAPIKAKMAMTHWVSTPKRKPTTSPQMGSLKNQTRSPRTHTPTPNKIADNPTPMAASRSVRRAVLLGGRRAVPMP